jgi:ArsR family transcriptional regulator
MSKEVLPNIAFERNALIYKVLANKKRLQILNNIKYKELSVADLIKITKMSKANISQHLTLLRLNRLVTNRREGKSVYYKIINPKIIEPCVLFHNLYKKGTLR